MPTRRAGPALAVALSITTVTAGLTPQSASAGQPAGATQPASATQPAGVVPAAAASGLATYQPRRSRRAYGADPRSRNAYDDDGWGTHPVSRARLGLARYSGGAVLVRKELVPLVRDLFWLTENVYGYKIRRGQTFGYANRLVRGGSQLSNHARGLAIDINSLSNPMSRSFRTDLHPRLVRIWEQHGFDWGGYYRSRPDPMHFEFADNIRDVKRYAQSARRLVHKHRR